MVTSFLTATMSLTSARVNFLDIGNSNVSIIYIHVFPSHDFIYFQSRSYFSLDFYGSFPTVLS